MERISTAEAARRLGLSQTQVRRLVATGKLQAETLARPQGSKIMILWDATQDATYEATGTRPDATSTPEQHTPATPPDATGDATYAEHLRSEIDWLRNRLEMAEREREQLRQLVAMEQGTVLQLRQLLAAHAQNDATPDAPVASLTRQHAPWWAFWRWTPQTT